MAKPFCWSSTQIGLWGALKDAISRICSVTLIAGLRKCVIAPVLVILGAISDTSGDIWMGLARSDLFVYIGRPVIFV